MTIRRPAIDDSAPFRDVQAMRVSQRQRLIGEACQEGAGSGQLVTIERLDP
jgi:hypothetical protein